MKLKLKTDKKTIAKRIIYDAVIPIFVLAALILADYFSKMYFETHYELGETKGEVIKGFFRFRLVHNTGAAFSFAADKPWGQTLFKIITPIAICLFIAFYCFSGRKNVFSRYALVLVIAGTLGNYIDRLAKGYVVDFLSFTLLFGYDFPIFNLADTFLCVGIIIIFIYYIFFDKTLFKDDKVAISAPSEDLGGGEAMEKIDFGSVAEEETDEKDNTTVKESGSSGKTGDMNASGNTEKMKPDGETAGKLPEGK